MSISSKKRSVYLEQCYLIVCLLDSRKKVSEELLGSEFNIKTNEKGNQTKQLKDKISRLNQKINQVEKRLAKIDKQANELLVEAPFEDLARKYMLSKDEKYILMATFYRSNLNGRYCIISGKDILILVGYKPSQLIDKCELLQNLMKLELIEIVERYSPFSSTILDVDYSLTEKTMQHIIGCKQLFVSESSVEDLNNGPFFLKNNEKKDMILGTREPVINFDQIVLDETQKQEIEQVIFQIEKGNKLFSEWGFNQTIKYGKGATMLFYGPPGTGKTATSEAIAQRLGKKIGIANYSRILSMWFGNSEKNLVKIFEEAKECDCVLVFDEADSLFAKRLIEFRNTDRTYNYMTNLLMQEIERYEGLVILTTNRELVMDEAFSRRILFKIKFDIPKSEERAKIWRALIPATAPIADDVDFIELGKRFELSGGEIKNVVINVIRNCGYSGEGEINMATLVKFARKEIENSLRDKKANKLGFTA